MNALCSARLPVYPIRVQRLLVRSGLIALRALEARATPPVLLFLYALAVYQLGQAIKNRRNQVAARL